MPNHCKNTITITGEKGYLEDFIHFHLTDMKKPLDTDDLSKNDFIDFSFNSVLPRPAELEGISTGSTMIDGVRHKVWRGGFDDAVAISAEEQYQLISDYGHTNLYDWCIANWDTKWDAYDYELHTPLNIMLFQQPVFVPYNDATTYGMEGKAPFYMLEMSFTTAWSTPENVLRVLSCQNPRLLICTKWREEGGMEGELVFIGGNRLHEASRQSGYELHDMTRYWAEDDLRRLADKDYKEE